MLIDRIISISKLIKKKFTSEVKRATYLTVILFSLLLFVNNKKRAPIEGNNIRDERIGKFIILQLRMLIKQRNQLALQMHTDI